MNTINRITGLIHDLLSRIVTLLLATLVVIVTVQIAGRLIPALPYLLWTEEIARFILVAHLSGERNRCEGGFPFRR